MINLSLKLIKNSPNSAKYPTFNKTQIQNYGTDYKNINRNYWQFMN